MKIHKLANDIRLLEGKITPPVTKMEVPIKNENVNGTKKSKKRGQGK